MKQAWIVKEGQDHSNGYKRQVLVELSEPIEYKKYNWSTHEETPEETDYIIVSHVLDSFVNETKVFPADSPGHILDYLHLQEKVFELEVSEEDVLRAFGFDSVRRVEA